MRKPDAEKTREMGQCRASVCPPPMQLRDQRIQRSDPLDFLPFDTGMNDNPTQALQAACTACEAGHEADLLHLLHNHKHSSALQLLNSSCLSLAARGGHLGIVEILLQQNDYLPPADGQVGSVEMCEWVHVNWSVIHLEP